MSSSSDLKELCACGAYRHVELEWVLQSQNASERMHWPVRFGGCSRDLHMAIDADTPVQPSDPKETNPKAAVGVAKVPASTLPQNVMAEVGLAMLEGALKYGRHNYRVSGARASVYYDGARRHLDDWWEGVDTDPDSGLSHITKAIAGLVVLRDCMIRGLFTDDRPPKSPKGWLEELNTKAKALLEKYPDPKPAHTEKP